MSVESMMSELALMRTADLSEPLLPYMELIKELEKCSAHHLKSRASFIRDQCNGFSGAHVFEKYRVKWGIPKFKDGLVTVNDFKRGFLFTFRHHTNASADAVSARDWFMHADEARFACRYELWDVTAKICLKTFTGSYAQILQNLNH